MSEPVTAYQPGQRVLVNAYGAWRSSSVNRVGRTRVNVNVVVNRAGRVVTKWVYPAHITPWRSV